MSNQPIVSDSHWDDIRTVKLDEELWFVLKDICAKLGIVDAKQVAERLDQNGVRQTAVADSLGRLQSTTVINRSNLISFLSRSNKPEAFSLLDWMYRQVIAASQSPDVIVLLQEIADLREQSQLYLSMAEDVLRVEMPENAATLEEPAEIEAIVYSVRKLIKEVRAALKEKKLEPDLLLDLLRKMEKKMAILEERTAQTDAMHVAISSHFGEQETALKVFHEQALTLLPPARPIPQIEVPKQGEI